MVGDNNEVSSAEELRLVMNIMGYKIITGIILEVNTVLCCKLSAGNFLKNNYVNFTLLCLDADFSKYNLL